MNKAQTANAIAVMQAFIEGKPCRWSPRAGGTFWFSLAEQASPSWNWDLIEYQVVPETVKYRRALMRTRELSYVYVLHTHNSASHIEQSEFFVRWIDKEWIEETV